MTQRGSNKRLRRLVIAFAATAGLLAVSAWVLQRRAPQQDVGAASVATAAGTQTVDQSRRQRAAAAEAKSATKRQASAAIALPPAGTPLVQFYNDLKARADAGDAAAASRLFVETRHCYWARESVRTMPRLLDTMVNADTSKFDADMLTSHEQALAKFQSGLAKARDAAQTCDGLSEAQLLLAPAARRAAQLGDASAANCYVGGVMLFSDGLLDHPEWLADYKASALAIAQQGLQRGDWNMVAQLQRAYSGNKDFSPLGQLTGADPTQNYRLLRLLRLGASDRDVAMRDRDLAEVAQTLPAQDIADGDAWATRMFRENFDSQATQLADIDVRSCSP